MAALRKADTKRRREKFRERRGGREEQGVESGRGREVSANGGARAGWRGDGMCPAAFTHKKIGKLKYIYEIL